MKKEWCIPPEQDEKFVCQMEEILDIYKKPYDPEYPQVCMDESSKQLIEEKRTPIKAKPGDPEKYDTEYIRKGTANMFLAFEPLKGKRYIKITDQRTKVDWAKFIKDLVDIEYKDAKKIILIMDNLNTHHKSSLYKAFPPEKAKRLADKIEIHYTPKHGSWLNVAEIEFSHLSRQCLDNRIPDSSSLKKKVEAWTKNRNSKQIKTKWRFTTQDARIKLAHLYPLI